MATKTRLLIVLLTLAAGLPGGVLAQAVRPPADGRAIRRLALGLPLEPQQRARIRQIIQGQSGAIRQARQGKTAAHQAFKAAVQTGDPEQIRAAGAVLGSATSELAIARMDLAKSIKEVLTPQQWQRLQARMGRPPRDAAPMIRRGPGRRAGPGRGMMPPPDRFRRRPLRRMGLNADGIVTRQEQRALLQGPRQARPWRYGPQ